MPTSKTFKLHVLDMGKTMYGDSLVLEIGKRRILIDGGHLGDANPQDGHPSLPTQLATLFGATTPHHFDLLVVTHCHADHIGCLPGLVQDGIITADRALVADPDLGWGITGTDAAPVPLDMEEARALAAVREEDVSLMPAAELDAFLTDAGFLQTNYRAMLTRLAADGCTVTRYKGPADGTKIEKAFTDIKLTVHGPTKNHLKVCAASIAQIGRDALDAVARLRRSGRGVDAARFVLGDIALDQAGLGAALNNQSIVLSFEANGRRILLPGDMQLAKPELSGLDTEMTTLLTALGAAGPWDVIKTPHHTSYNAIAPAVLAAFPATNIWVHSGGSNDSGHPEKSALTALKALNTGGRKISFARTDRNGLITFSLSKSKVGIKVGKGGLKDYSANTSDSGSEATPAASMAESAVSEYRNAGNGVEIRTFVPLGASVRVSFEVAADGSTTVGGPGSGPDRGGPFRLAGGRKLPPLLFVTDVAKLRSAVGSFATECLVAIKDGGHCLLDLKGESDSEKAVALSRKANQDPALAGVVLLGGHAIVPARIRDTIPNTLRKKIAGTADDPDNFYVWSDEPYGDRDGDAIPELPVTRVPDCGKGEFLRTQLAVDGARGGKLRAGYRNVHRPFADGVYATIAGTAPMIRSEQATPDTVGDGGVRGDAVYIMMHGSDTDGSRFWGETSDGRGLLALTPENIGPIPGALVFAGCCWGAMTWAPMAVRALAGGRITSRSPTNSFALRCLANGARVFIGATGANYSPDVPPWNSGAGPLHKAFWKQVAMGKPPARALFDAKVEYTAWMQSATQTPESLAVSFKTLRQYACLGLGW